MKIILIIVGYILMSIMFGILMVSMNTVNEDDVDYEIKIGALSVIWPVVFPVLIIIGSMIGLGYLSHRIYTRLISYRKLRRSFNGNKNYCTSEDMGTSFESNR